MSEVWLARDRELDRRVAVKLHLPHADPARFEREAHAAARLSHPHVAKIFHFGDAEGRPYLVLEYLPGGSLEDRLVSGEPVADQDSERMARDIAAGLAHADEHGVVHRDLKPSNVLFDAEGRAKIADFGIARAYDQTTLTDMGTILGTAAYMSPEQASGESVTPASDVYAFGTILFHMLTGQLPFEGESAIEVAVKKRSEPAPAVESHRPDAPAGLSALTATALAKDPSARPSAADLLTALESNAPLMSPATADTVAVAAARPRWGRRPFIGLFAFGCVALAGLALGLFGFAEGDDAPGTPVSATAPAASTARTESTAPGEMTSPGTQETSTASPTTGTETTTQPTTAEETVATTTEPAPATTTTEPPSEGTTPPAP
jgi:eukaryotic-like serine/threonine-protein kinase